MKINTANCHEDDRLISHTYDICDMLMFVAYYYLIDVATAGTLSELLLRYLLVCLPIRMELYILLYI